MFNIRLIRSRRLEMVCDHVSCSAPLEIQFNSLLLRLSSALIPDIDQIDDQFDHRLLIRWFAFGDRYRIISPLLKLVVFSVPFAIKFLLGILFQ